jgi:tetratricopeptide (TPR) repeat protein
MKRYRLIPFALFLLAAGHTTRLLAVEEGDAVQGLQQEWAQIKYQMPPPQRAKAMQGLAERAHQVTQASPPGAEGRRGEAQVWEAIILASLAGEQGGLGALSLVEQARDLLLEVERRAPDTLEGSVFTSLGSLYYQVPGWPIGFGDDAKAREYLQRALALNPEGIDPNYFYGDFLIEEGEYKEAIGYLEKAVKAPPRPGREVADEGRRQEAGALLEKAQTKLR